MCMPTIQDLLKVHYFKFCISRYFPVFSGVSQYFPAPGKYNNPEYQASSRIPRGWVFWIYISGDRVDSWFIPRINSGTLKLLWSPFLSQNETYLTLICYLLCKFHSWLTQWSSPRPLGQGWHHSKLWGGGAKTRGLTTYGDGSAMDPGTTFHWKIPGRGGKHVWCPARQSPLVVSFLLLSFCPSPRPLPRSPMTPRWWWFGAIRAVYRELAILVHPWDLVKKL